MEFIVFVSQDRWKLFKEALQSVWTDNSWLGSRPWVELLADEKGIDGKIGKRISFRGSAQTFAEIWFRVGVLDKNNIVK